MPSAMRGKKLAGLGAVWDAYATFAFLAGVDPTDQAAAAAGLPPVDSLNLWPYWSGQKDASPRRLLEIGSTTCERPGEPACINKWGWGDVRTVVQGLLVDMGAGKGLWKLLTGRTPMNGWQGPLFPNASTPHWLWSFNEIFDCGEEGCLFRLDEDPTEQTDLRLAQPAIAAAMLDQLRTLNQTTFSPYRGPGEQNGVVAAACDAARGYGGFFGPFLSPLTLSRDAASASSR